LLSSPSLAKNVKIYPSFPTEENDRKVGRVSVEAVQDLKKIFTLLIKPNIFFLNLKSFVVNED